MSVGGIIALVLFLTAPLDAAERMTRFVAQPESKVRIDGKGTIHDWQAEGRLINGSLEAGDNFPIEPRQQVKPGKVNARIEVSIPVNSLEDVDLNGKSSGKTMNNLLHRFLKEQTNPRIQYQLNELFLKSSPNSEDSGYQFDSQGSLVVAGVTNQISMPMRVTPFGDGRLKITGNVNLKMTDFGIQPPVGKIASDAKTNEWREFRLSEDEIKLGFEWFLEPAPIAAQKK